MIRRGDIIEMVCKVKRNGETNIKYAVASRILERVDREDSAGTVESCAGGLSGIFETQTVSVMNEYAEGAVTPSSSFTSTQNEEASALDAVTTPEEKVELAEMSPADRAAKQKELLDVVAERYYDAERQWFRENRDEIDIYNGFTDEELDLYDRWVAAGITQMIYNKGATHIHDTNLIGEFPPSAFVEAGKPPPPTGVKAVAYTLIGESWVPDPQSQKE
jgi:hypothetical protein